jgi:recombination protein RecT
MSQTVIDFIQTKLDGDAYKAELAKVSKSCNPERFVAILKNYVKSSASSGKIIEALGNSAVARQTFLQEALKCAADGLVPDGKEAVINTSYSKEHGTIFQYMPMVLGITKTIYNTGLASNISTGVIHENDKYEYDLGSAPFIKHQPSFKARGEMVAAFASVQLKGHTYPIVEIMTADEVNAVAKRSRSKTKDGTPIGPWATDTGEMWRKTALRRLSKRLPRSNEQAELLDNVLNSVDEDFDLSVTNDEAVTEKAMPKGLEKVANTTVATEVETEVNQSTNEVF